MSGPSGVNLGMPLTFGKPEVDENTGKIRMQGNVLGIDVQETVDALTDAMKIQIKAPQDQIESDNKKLNALTSLESKVNDLSAAATALSGAQGATSSSGVFSKFLYTIPNAAAANDISVQIGTISAEQSFQFRVQQLASIDAISSATGIADTNADLGWTGTFTLGTYTVTTDGKSAKQIMDEINANSATASATAQLVTSSDGSHLMFQSTAYAVPLTLANNVTGAGTALPSSSTKSVDDLSAKFTYNGMPITATSNTVTNIPNLAITLQNVSTTDFNVSIKHDRAATATAITNFVDSYNALQDEIAANMKMSADGKSKADDAILFSNNILNSITTQTGLAIADGVYGLSDSVPRTLGDLGISIGKDTSSKYNIKLTIDTEQFYDKINNNFDDVKRVFSFDATLSDSTFSLTKHPPVWTNELAQSNVFINVARDNTGALSVTFTHDGQGDLTVYNGSITEYAMGSTIKGPVGTPYEGLNLIVVDTNLILNGGSRQTTLNATQGIGDKIVSITSTITDPKVGDFAAQRDAITDHKTILSQQISTIEKSIKAKREALMASFQAMQQALNIQLSLQNSLNQLLNPSSQ
ncbi:MAG: flagellar filament capping protein FliD [Alphaproteobacteria bacterium]|nr:flagellar filament capping protein FliD [Alphaproteobacteria bacterium]